MDKKNTMLLTVIAVATLLVAVVGATFAYFSVTTTGKSATANVTTKAEAVGTVSLESASGDLYLNISAAQMSENLAGSKYYAQTTADAAASTTVATPVTVATFSAEEVADAEVTYTCTFDYAITTSGDEAALAVLAADGKYDLTAGTGVTLGTTSYNLGAAQTGSGSLEFTDGTSTTISAVAYVNNTDQAQNDLAGKEITTTITFDNFVCKTK